MYPYRNPGARIAARPIPPTLPRASALLLALLWLAPLRAQEPVGERIGGAAPGDRAGFAVSISGDGERLAVGAFLNDDAAEDGGHVRVFARADDGDEWRVMGAAVAGAGIGDNLGQAVALSADGTHLAVGAPYADGGGGDAGLLRVLVYDEGAGRWDQIGGDVYGATPGEQLGSAVALSRDGRRVVVGAPRADAGAQTAGRARVYDYDAATDVWLQVGPDIEGATALGQLGYAVAISDDGARVAVGIPFSNAAGVAAGEVRTYDFDGTAWQPVGGPLRGAAPGDVAGWAVALSADGRRLAYGAPYGDGGGRDAGEVRVYRLDDDAAGAWRPEGTPLEGRAPGDLVGSSVALSASGARVVFGATGQDSGGDGAGQVCLYDYDAATATWTQAGLDVDGEGRLDGFGTSVALTDNGERVVVGAPFHDADGEDAGQVRVYDMAPIGEAGTSNTAEIGAAALQVGPNPARDVIRVSGAADPATLELTLYDGAGREVARGRRGAAQVACAGLPAGVHVLVVRDGGGLRGRHRVVITE